MQGGPDHEARWKSCRPSAVLGALGSRRRALHLSDAAGRAAGDCKLWQRHLGVVKGAPIGCLAAAGAPGWAAAARGLALMFWFAIPGAFVAAFQQPSLCF